MFRNLVDITDLVCRKINKKKAEYLIYDTSGIELPVKENNPKFLETKLNDVTKFSSAKKDSSDRIKWICDKAKPFNKGKFACNIPCHLFRIGRCVYTALIKTSGFIQEYKETLNIGKIYTDTECKLNGQLT